MARNITAAMAAHIKQEVTTLAVCVRITPDKNARKPEILLTEHDKDIVYGGETYRAADSFVLSAIHVSKDFRNDNTEIKLGNKTLADMEGLKNANVSIFYVNHADLSQTMGAIDVFFGFITALSLNEDTKELSLTVSGLGKRLSNKYLPKYSRTCRTNLGSTKCGVPVLPAFRPDAFIAYPRTFTVGEQTYDRPTTLGAVPTYSFDGWCAGGSCATGCPATWTCVSPSFTRTAQATPSTLSQTVTRPPAAVDGDLLFFEVDCSAGGVTLEIQSLDTAGDITQLISYDFAVAGKHNIATYVQPNDASYVVRITVPPNTAITVTPTLNVVASADIPTTRNKLARVTSKAGRDQLIIPNAAFYKDGAILNSTNPNGLTDWSITLGGTGQYSVSSSVLTAQDMTISQTVLLPPLACNSLSAGCYFTTLYNTITGGALNVTLETLDELGNVLTTASATATTSGLSFQMTNDPVSLRITYTFPAGTAVSLSDVEVYIYNALLAAPSDPQTVTLATPSDKGTLSDIWLTETTPLYYNTTVASVVTPYTDQVFVEGGVIPPSVTHIGQIYFVDGANAGFTRSARAFDPTTKRIELDSRLPFPMAAGDKIIVALGCNRHILTCGGTFNNAINFRGEPYLPGAVKLGQILGV